MKKILMTSLALSLCFALSVFAGASGPDEDSQNLTAMNILQVESIFDGTSDVLNSEGNDITIEFIAENSNAYSSGDYISILDSLVNNSFVLLEKDSTPSAETRLVVNGSVIGGPITIFFNSPSGGVSKDWVKVQFKGTYQYNDYNNTIVAGTGITGTVIGKSTPMLNMQVGSSNSSWRIDNNSKRITFTEKYVALLYPAGMTIPTRQPGTFTFSKTYA